MIYEGKPEQRIAYIRALRDLADWLEANPDVPVGISDEHLQLSTHGTEEERLQDMQDAAAVFGSAPVDPYGDGTHLEVGKRFGPIKYYVHFARDAFTEEYHEQQRLGAEALAAKKAAEQVHVTGPVAALLIGGEVAPKLVHAGPYTQSGRDTGHAICGSGEGPVTVDGDATCPECLALEDEQYESVRGVSA